jgi:hypothetical protein
MRDNVNNVKSRHPYRRRSAAVPSVLIRPARAPATRPGRSLAFGRRPKMAQRPMKPEFRAGRPLEFFP